MQAILFDGLPWAKESDHKMTYKFVQWLERAWCAIEDHKAHPDTVHARKVSEGKALNSDIKPVRLKLFEMREPSQEK